MVLGVEFLTSIIKLLMVRPLHVYASANAVQGMLVISSFALLLFLNMTGFPEKAPRIEFNGSTVIIGETKAEELLAQGYYFKDEKPENIIVNERNNHFYYGEKTFLMKDQKVYGIVYLTPAWRDVAPLKDCIVTRVIIDNREKTVGSMKVNGKDIKDISWEDIKNKELIEVFGLQPASYKEFKEYERGNTNFNLQLQSELYSLWKRYTITGNFNSHGSCYRYEVGAQYSLWE